MDDCINGHTSLLQKSVNVVSHRRKNFEFSSTEPHVLQDAMDVAKHTMKDSAKVIIDHGKDLSLRYQYPFIHKHATQIAGMLSLFLAVPLIGFVWWCRNSRASDSTITVNARSAQLDFAKFWLMVMVIVIHTRMIRALWSTPPSDQMMIFIKPWGTRTFAMISGIFCQKEPNSQWFESMLVRLIFPWLAYCIIIDPLLFEAASGRWQTVFVTWAHEVSKSLFVVDVGVVWFLVGLITWKLLGGSPSAIATTFAIGSGIHMVCLCWVSSPRSLPVGQDHCDVSTLCYWSALAMEGHGNAISRVCIQVSSWSQYSCCDFGAARNIRRG